MLIAVGVLIDVSKYIFWGVKEDRTYRFYMSLALVLMAFSWMASVAFFISSEDTKLAVYRKQTAEYVAYKLEIVNIDHLIKQKQVISNKRLESVHHKQWDKSEAINREIQTLTEQRLALVLDEPNRGMNAAKKALVSAAFFQAISSLLNIEASTVRNMFYTILALLIEACALGLITLCNAENHVKPITQKKKTVKGTVKSKAVPKRTLNKTIEAPQTETPQLTPQVEPKPVIKAKPKAAPTSGEERLIQDIKSGTVMPGFNYLKKRNYEVSQGRIKEILLELKSKGILKPGIRGSLKLATPPLTVVNKK